MSSRAKTCPCGAVHTRSIVCCILCSRRNVLGKKKSAAQRQRRRRVTVRGEKDQSVDLAEVARTLAESLARDEWWTTQRCSDGVFRQMYMGQAMLMEHGPTNYYSTRITW